MKLNSFILPALASVATATDSYAETYMLRRTEQSTASSPSPPSIPNPVAQAILLQRLSSDPTLAQLEESLDDDALSYITSFGKPSPPLFSDGTYNEPKQLVIAFSGVKTPNQQKQLKAAIPRVPLAFKSSGLNSLPAETSSKCAFGPATNPTNTKCWDGNTQYLHYDATKDSKIISQLSINLATLKAHALNGEMETTIVFLDPTPANEEDELRRRQFKGSEKVIMAEDEDTTASETTFVESTHDTTDTFIPAAQKKTGPIPACFTSLSSCESGTNSCSDHGVCVNKYPSSEGDGGLSSSAAKSACYFCQCKETRATTKTGLIQTTNWGGSACQKKDISTPFWLFVGLTVTLVGTVAFSINLLFSVGEEKLPGVIGAGVSRSK
ncbi:hypothetical protein F5Y16DRAFT_266256 [Xylariaceae sp. FL0255]|nr:hypothetical protein F5Y16DRAFT_266256 [Xylariaceae sp. FL0255]